MRKLIAAMNMTLDGFCDNDKFLLSDKYLDKIIDELAKGKKVEKILRTAE